MFTSFLLLGSNEPPAAEAMSVNKARQQTETALQFEGKDATGTLLKVDLLTEEKFGFNIKQSDVDNKCNRDLASGSGSWLRSLREGEDPLHLCSCSQRRHRQQKVSQMFFHA